MKFRLLAGAYGARAGWVAAVLACALIANPARAEASAAPAFTTPMSESSGVPTYLLEIKDGELHPERIVVPAKTRFRVLVRNIGSKPAEFESNQLRQEEVLFMGAEVTVTITPLSPGSYDYFNEFDMQVIGKIIAREAPADGSAAGEGS